MVVLNIKYKSLQTIQAKFFVCESGTAILGLRPSINLGLIQINCSTTSGNTRKLLKNTDYPTSEYPDIFQSSGNFAGKQIIHM